MPSLFTDNANLSNMSDEPLYVQSVVHEAWIKVEEKGTEAAAATASLLGLPQNP